MCLCTLGRFFFLLKSHCLQSFSLSLSPSLVQHVSPSSPLCDSWNALRLVSNFLEPDWGDIRGYCQAFFFFCSCSGYAHCRTKERSRITKKYVLKDLLTPRAERLLRWQNFQQFNYRVRNIKKKKAVLWFLVRKRLSAKLWKAVNELWTLSPSLGVISVLKRMSV